MRDMTVSSLEDRLEAMILTGRFEPGDRIPAERLLAVELGVSRSRLREAIKQLSSLGMLVSRQGGGTYVTSMDEVQPLRTALIPLAPLAAGEAGYWRDIMELRKSLDADAAAFAAERADMADKARIKAACDACSSAFLSESVDMDAAHTRLPLAKLDARFHMSIARASHNIVLYQIMTGLEGLLESSISDSLDTLYRLPDVPRELDLQHRRIFDAILAGRGEEARAAAIRHLVFVEDQLAAIETASARQRRSAQAFDHLKTMQEARP